jgi:hypothetical protein
MMRAGAGAKRDTPTPACRCRRCCRQIGAFQAQYEAMWKKFG